MATQPTKPIIKIAESDVNLPSTGQPNKNEPSVVLQTTGYDRDQTVTAEELNYIFDNFSEWLTYLKLSQEEQGTSISDLQNINIIAGDGINGGGDLTADRTITLGTPSTLDGSTSNSVTVDSHTHDLNMASQAEAQTGTDNVKLVTPLRVREAVPYTFNPSSVGASTDTITLPNGLIMKFEILAESADNATQVNWSTPFPNGVLSIQITPIYDGAPELISGGNVRSYDRFGMIFSVGDQYGQGTTAFVTAIGY